MKRYQAEAILITAGGAVALAAANLWLPFVFMVMVGFALGVVAFSRVFMVAGPLTIRRDVLMFAVVIGAIVLARFVAAAACAAGLAASAQCTVRYLRASSFANALSIAAPIMFFWSWVRYRLLREQIAACRRR